jgi:hypothetical protein
VVAGEVVLLRVKGECPASGREGENDAVVGIFAIGPGLHQRRDIDQDELIETGCRNGDGFAAGGGYARRWRVLVVERGLAPGGIDLIDIEASGSREGVDIEAQRGLGDGRVGRQGFEIEADVGVRPFLHGEKKGRSVGLGLVGADGEAVVSGWSLAKAESSDGEKKHGKQCEPQRGLPTCLPG